MRRLLLLLLASAFAALAQDANKVCFYIDVSYGGTELCGVEGQRIEDLNLNDKFSSVKVPIGLQVLAFIDDSFHGSSMIFRENTPDLGSFLDKISSFIVQPAEACFYTGKQYAGTEHCVSVSDVVNLSMQSTLNNNFESVKIPQGLLVKLFTDEGLQGRFTWITADSTDLDDFNDVITSLIVEYDNQVCFYTDPNYQGMSSCARPGEAHDISGTSNLNDQFSSVRVPHDVFVTAYYDDDYHGTARMFTHDVSNLNDFTNQISSFVVGFSGTACFYTGINWGGSKFCAPYGDKIDVAANFDTFNDRFQSIIIPDDLQVKSYQHGSYEGQMVAYKTTISSLKTFTNMISSFEVTAATTTLYDNFADADVTTLRNMSPFNLTVCSFVDNQGAWKLLYGDSCRSVSKRYICTSIYTPNLWRISAGSGVINDGGSVCQLEFGSDFTFSTPTNAHSNSLLSGLIPSNGVWIDVYYDAFNNEYSHRMKRSTECGGISQKACSATDSTLQTFICLISVVACQETYCNDGLTKFPYTTSNGVRYLCTCPTNYRVRRDVNSILGACYAAVNVIEEALTGEEIVDRLLTRRSTTRSQLQTAWTDSFLGRDLMQERGGWIYANPSNPKDLQVVLAPRSASGTFRSNGTSNPAINLEGASTANAQGGWVLVANFHTHPLETNQGPSGADIRNAYHRGVPGIVISRRRIYVYGPERRENFHPSGNPRAYPDNGNRNDPRDSSRVARENPFSF